MTGKNRKSGNQKSHKMRRLPCRLADMQDNQKCEQWIWIEQEMPEIELYRLKNAKN